VSEELKSLRTLKDLVSTEMDYIDLTHWLDEWIEHYQQKITCDLNCYPEDCNCHELRAKVEVLMGLKGEKS